MADQALVGEQIVPSGIAMRMAQQWLGVASLEEALAADPPQDPELDQPRPPLLGLGADPRKHRKTLLVSSKVEKRLSQRLQPRAGLAKAADEGPAANSRQKDEGVSGASEDEEEEGRAGAIKSRQPRPAAQTPGWLQPSGGKGKKRKRQKQQAGPLD